MMIRTILNRICAIGVSRLPAAALFCALFIAAFMTAFFGGNSPVMAQVNCDLLRKLD